MACENGYYEIVELLMQDKRVNPADRELEALQVARMAKIIDLLRADERVQKTLEDMASTFG